MTPETTQTPRPPFPDRMRKQAVETHTRRAANALEAIAADAAALLRKIQDGREVEAASARHLAEEAVRATEHLSVLETLAEVREWDEAEKTGDQ